jgi:hypothetical protein
VEPNKEGDGFARLGWEETKEEDAVGGARLTVETGSLFRFSRTLDDLALAIRKSVYNSQPNEPRSAVHLPFDRLQAVDVSFRRTITPPLCYGREHSHYPPEINMPLAVISSEKDSVVAIRTPQPSKSVTKSIRGFLMMARQKGNPLVFG